MPISKSKDKTPAYLQEAGCTNICLDSWLIPPIGDNAHRFNP